MPSGQNVIILGCGIGGLVVANNLVKQARGAVSVTVVERKPNFQFPPSYPWLMMGWRSPKQVQHSLTSLTRKKIKVINETVEAIDVQNRRVRVQSSLLSFDHLIIALGAEGVPGDIPGFANYAYHIYDMESAQKFRDVVQNFPGGRLVIVVSRVPFKCPAAPYEAAFLLQDHFHRNGRQVEFDLFTPEAHPIPSAGPVVSKQVERMLVARGIRFHPEKTLQSIDGTTITFEDKEVVGYDLLFAVPPHRCPKPVMDAGLTDSSGWVPVNPQTLATKFESVYALGDVASIETPHGHVPFLPKAGVFAYGQAEVVANNLAVSITGRGERKVWDGTGSCFLEVSRGESAFLRGSFLSNPPRLEFHPPRRKWHLEKVVFEKYWMHHWF